MNSIRYSLKHLWKKPLLVISVFLGLVVAVAIVTTVPLYSDLATFKVLKKELKSVEEKSGIQRQPFDFVYRYIGSWHGNIAYDQLEKLDDYFDNRIEAIIGLPIGERIHFVSTDYIQLFQLDKPQTTANVLELVKLTSVDNLAEHITMIEGSLPKEGSNETLDALASNELANELGLVVGKSYALRLADNGTGKPWTQDIRITGIWIPTDQSEAYWSFYSSESFLKKLILNSSQFKEAVSTIKLPINEAAWRLSLDGNGITSQNVGQTLNQINTVQNQLNSIVMNTNLEISPVEALRQFSDTSNELTRILIFFAIPILVVIMLFLLMISEMFARSQQNEIAILRSRGASRIWIAGNYFWQWMTISLAAIPVGLMLGLFLTRFVSNTHSFMVFSIQNGGFPTLGRKAFFLAIGVVTFAILIMLIPVFKASKETILGYKRSAARKDKSEFWQRAYLDLLLLAITGYGLYILRSQGKLTLLGKSLGGNDPFTNPLMFLLPTLFILGLLLLSLRILPLLIEGFNHIGNRIQGVPFILVLRQFARSGHAHHTSLLLVGLTIGIAVFASSMAATMDQGMHDNIYYKNGADIRFYEGGEFVKPEDNSVSESIPGESAASSGDGYWNVIPISDYYSIPGVMGATRIGYYKGTTVMNAVTNAGSLIGVDRDSIESIIFYRPDFSRETLSDLMGRLASSPNAVLVNEELWTKLNLNIGDVIEIQTSATKPMGSIKFKVAGVFGLFPGWNKTEEKNAFIVNLDFLFDTWGRIQPYDVLLKTSETASPSSIIASVELMGVSVGKVNDSRGSIQNQIFSPKRQGALGLLSVGFISSTILAILAIITYVVFTFRERSIYLGVLRAIGLSSSQLRAAMLMEIGAIGLLGTILGNWIGIAASQLFIPVFPVIVQDVEVALPQTTVINWEQIGWMIFSFGIVFIVICVFYLIRSVKDKEFALIKLGETT